MSHIRHSHTRYTVRLFVHLQSTIDRVAWTALNTTMTLITMN